MHAPPPPVASFNRNPIVHLRKPRKTRAVSHTLHLPPAESDSLSQPLLLIDEFMFITQSPSRFQRLMHTSKDVTAVAGSPQASQRGGAHTQPDR